MNEYDTCAFSGQRPFIENERMSGKDTEQQGQRDEVVGERVTAAMARRQSRRPMMESESKGLGGKAAGRW